MTFRKGGEAPLQGTRKSAKMDMPNKSNLSALIPRTAVTVIQSTRKHNSTGRTDLNTLSMKHLNTDLIATPAGAKAVQKA